MATNFSGPRSEKTVKAFGVFFRRLVSSPLVEKSYSWAHIAAHVHPVVFPSHTVVYTSLTGMTGQSWIMHMVQ